jgi:hypothetical protein
MKDPHPFTDSRQILHTVFTTPRQTREVAAAVHTPARGETMSKTMQWMLGLAALLLVLAFAASMILPFLSPVTGGYGMMGQGMLGGWGRMGGFGSGMFIWPLMLIGIVLAVVFWGGRGQRPATAPSAAAPTALPVCKACSQSLQPGWKACPHCGERV